MQPRGVRVEFVGSHSKIGALQSQTGEQPMIEEFVSHELRELMRGFDLRCGAVSIQQEPSQCAIGEVRVALPFVGDEQVT